jgi:hypothetical protein
MARFSLTLTLDGIDLVLRPPVRGWRRSIVGRSSLTLDGYTPNGAPLFSGPSQNAFTRRYSWAFSANITEREALTLDLFAREQSPTNLILLKDEYDYLEPEVSPSRSFVVGSTITFETTRTTGFFEGDVWLELAEEHKQMIANHGCTVGLDDTYVNYTFSLLEVL